MSKVAFVLAATSLGPMIVNRFDRAVYPDGTPFGVGHQLLETGAYDAPDAGLFVQTLHLRRQHHGDGVVALDVGANVGAHTVAMAKACEGWGEVVALEAQERVYYALAGNVALNNLFNATCVHAAVAAVTGTLHVPRLDHTCAASFGSLELRKATEEDIGQVVDRTDGTEVPCVAIDDMDVERVDFIKLDVEGMEQEVLTGAVLTLERCKPILFVEWVKSDKQALWNRLDDMGYHVKQVGMNLLAIHRTDKVLDHLR